MMRIWLWPAWIGIVNLAGLLVGLVSDGAGDYLAWAALILPIGVVARCVYRRA